MSYGKNGQLGKFPECPWEFLR